MRKIANMTTNENAEQIGKVIVEDCLVECRDLLNAHGVQCKY